MQPLEQNSPLAIQAIQEPGGLLAATDRQPVTWLPGLIDQRIAITAGAGCGMSFVLSELVIQSLAQGKRVRVVDYGGSFRKLCDQLHGRLLADWHPDVWSDPSNALVVVDLESIPRQSQQTVLDAIAATPSEFWLLATEVWMYGGDFLRADAIASIDLPPCVPPPESE